MKVLLFSIVTIILLCFCASAEQEHIGYGKQDLCIDLIQTCPSCSSVSIVSVTYPNGTTSSVSYSMVQSGTSYTYSFCNTSQIGEYAYCTLGDVDGTDTNACVSFGITYTGDKIILEEVYIYIIALIFIIILIFGLYFIKEKLPDRDSTDEDNNIVQINLLKHLRSVLWAFIWILGIACLFIVSNLGIAFLPNAMIGNLFFTLYKVFFWITIVMIPLYFIWIFWKIFQDKEMKKLIERGIEIKGKP